MTATGVSRTRRWDVPAGTWAYIAALVFLAPLASARELDGRALVFPGVCLGLGLLTAWRPRRGLTGLMMLLPLVVLVEWFSRGVLLGGDVADGLVLTFVGAASVHVFGRNLPASRLAGPAALFAVVVVTSAVAGLRDQQLVAPGHPLLPDLWHYVTSAYWTEVREFPVVRHLLRWLAWMALAVSVEQLVMREPAARRQRVMVEWLLSGLAGAAIVLVFVAGIVAGRAGDVTAALTDVLVHLRFAVLQPDVNATASYLLLFLLPAAVLGVARRRVWLLVAVVPPLLAAFALTRSRAAVGAAIVVLCAGWLLRFFRPSSTEVRRRPVLLAVAAVLVAAAALVATTLATGRSNASVADAAGVRAELATAGWEAFRRHPILGAGLSDYIPATRRFVTADMPLLRALAPQGENAHNNYLQIAVELGGPALLIFLWLAARGIMPGWSSSRSAADPVTAMALGLTAFLVSCVLGHPFLVPLAGAGFFVALGVNAGLAGPRARTSSAVEKCGWLAAGLYLGAFMWHW